MTRCQSLKVAGIVFFNAFALPAAVEWISVLDMLQNKNIIRPPV